MAPPKNIFLHKAIIAALATIQFAWDPAHISYFAMSPCIVDIEGEEKEHGLYELENKVHWRGDLGPEVLDSSCKWVYTRVQDQLKLQIKRSYWSSAKFWIQRVYMVPGSKVFLNKKMTSMWHHFLIKHCQSPPNKTLFLVWETNPHAWVEIWVQQ